MVASVNAEITIAYSLFHNVALHPIDLQRNKATLKTPRMQTHACVNNMFFFFGGGSNFNRRNVMAFF